MLNKVWIRSTDQSILEWRINFIETADLLFNVHINHLLSILIILRLYLHAIPLIFACAISLTMICIFFPKLFADFVLVAVDETFILGSDTQMIAVISYWATVADIFILRWTIEILVMCHRTEAFTFITYLFTKQKRRNWKISIKNRNHRSG